MSVAFALKLAVNTSPAEPSAFVGGTEARQVIEVRLGQPTNPLAPIVFMSVPKVTDLTLGQ